MQHVLIIEDELLLAKCYRDMAMFAGAASVEIATHEEAAIDAARRRRPTIIVSDVDLGDGGNGPNAVARIWALRGRIPVIFITGNPEHRAAKALATAIITKPCSAITFAQTFSAVAAAHRHRAVSYPAHNYGPSAIALRRSAIATDRQAEARQS